MAKLCKRTNCLWKPGEPVKGMFCYYAYSGSIPCTGVKKCLFCGQEESQ